MGVRIPPMQIGEMMRGEEALKKLRQLGFNCQRCGNYCRLFGDTLDLNDEETKR